MEPPDAERYLRKIEMIRPNKWLSSVLLALAAGFGVGSIALFGFWPVGTLRIVAPSWPTWMVLGWDGALSLLFFVQHSAMIRRAARRRLGTLVAPVYQRAIYAIASGLALLAVVLLWQPCGPHVFSVPRPVSQGLVAVGGGLFVWGFASLRHFDPLGTADLVGHLLKRPVRACEFAARGAYGVVRHPIYTAIILLLWAHPDVTADRLLFDASWTIWIIVAARLEEADLIAELGDAYRSYRRAVPMLIPGLRSR
jgi:methanethiol S-methyltransferase